MIKRFDSSDTNVSKFVFDWVDAVAEAVLYRYESYLKRTVICCSIQSGCPVACSFCGTGKFYQRDLTCSEIMQQVDHCLSVTKIDPRKIEKLQIMFMSMGEPFLCNQETFFGSIKSLYKKYPNADLLVSTSAPFGIIDKFQNFIKLSKEIPKLGLQFSVHESNDSDRKKLIPTKTSSLQEIAELGENWALEVKRKPFFNYCVHPKNSLEKNADEIRKLFNPSVWECTLSVICEKSDTIKSSIERQLDIIEKFKKLLLDRGYSIRVFNPAGQDDIGGGCGMLWYFQKWAKERKL